MKFPAWRHIVFLLSSLFLTAPSVSATTLLPISLQQLSTRAALIFHGEVTGNTVKKDDVSGHIATFTEFNIIELIKGDAGSTYTIKQLGGRLTGSGMTLKVHGVPEFETGKTYVVFLPEKSSLGFSSPLGLHQGSYPVMTINNEQIVSHGRNLNEHPPANLSPADNPAVQLPLAVSTEWPYGSRLGDFIHTVRAYNTQ